jgi:hypothetical protein
LVRVFLAPTIHNFEFLPETMRVVAVTSCGDGALDPPLHAGWRVKENPPYASLIRSKGRYRGCRVKQPVNTRWLDFGGKLQRGQHVTEAESEGIPPVNEDRISSRADRYLARL